VLHTAQLGRSGLEITRLGLGAWAIGGGGYQGSWGPSDDADSVRTIVGAIERGINWIDTAAAYGLGHSERVVGRAVAELPEGDRPLVFTKCGLLWNEGDTEFTNSLAPDSIRRECDASLERLGVDVIDLYFMHWPTWDETPIEDSWATMAELVDAGKVRTIGVSNFDLDEIERCEAVRHVDALQPELNMINREAAADKIAWAEEHGTGVIVYSPMASGLLTGGFDHERLASLAEDDWRRGHANFQEPAFSQNLALVERLGPVAERVGASLPELVVAWTLAWPAVTAAIVGARTIEALEGWVGAADVELSPDDLDEIARAIEETGAGTGPSRPTALAA
jgi:aryl-alcohol dehydrogenase-like predicted oxidoreductase